MGGLLRQRMAEEPGLQLVARCDSRLYEGAGQCVTAFVPGREPSREVWLFGHACEQGAHDNCSGVSVCVEAARMLGGLIESGALPRPRFSIRVLATEECVGMLAFAAQRPALLRRAVVGMNIDAVGDATAADRPMIVHYGPLSGPNFGWAVAGEIARVLADGSGGEYHVTSRCEPPSGDDMIADPNCGVPTLWLGSGGDATGYHSSADTPAVCCDTSLRSSTLLAAAWAYVMADLNDRLTGMLLLPATRWMERHMLAGPAGDALRLRRWVAGQVLRQPGRWGVSDTIYARAAARYCPIGAGPLDGLPTIGRRYVRTTWGTCTLETLPPGRAEGLSRWSRWQNAALYWNHGDRPLAAVERLTRAEAGSVPDGGVVNLLDACVEAGLARRVS
jgi:hypothetical protein